MAKLITPPRTPRKKKEALSEERITDTACRIGMVCGILMGVDEKACSHLERIWKKDPIEFKYGNEARLVRAARHKMMAGRGK